MRTIATLFNRLANYCEKTYHHGCGYTSGCSISYDTDPDFLSGCGSGNSCG